MFREKHLDSLEKNRIKNIFNSLIVIGFVFYFCEEQKNRKLSRSLLKESSNSKKSDGLPS
jgi:hypothetical protein